MEYMSQYDCSIQYISGDNNSVADTLLWLPNTIDQTSDMITSILQIKSDPLVVQEIKEGY
jgi:hypothetical protein